MYKCLDCEEVFETPEIAAETYECWGRPSHQENAYCPFCYGWALEEYDPDDYEEDLQ